MTDREVLIISNPDDAHVARVAGAIAGLGGCPVLLFPECAGADVQVAIAHSPASQFAALVRIGGVQHDLREFASVWFRRPRAPSFDGVGLRARAEEFGRDE